MRADACEICENPHSRAAWIRLQFVNTGSPHGGEPVLVNDDENHESVKHIAGEIAITWIFALSLVGVILFIISLADKFDL